MKKLIKPASLLFYCLIIILFFFIGLYVAKLVDAGKGQMLAGGAIVLFYGLVSAGLAFVLALFVAFGVKHSTLIRINKIVGTLFFILVCVITYLLMSQ